MLKVECDRCGKSELVYSPMSLPGGWMEFECKHLCESCARELSEWLKPLPKRAPVTV